MTNQFDIVPHVLSLLTGWVHVDGEIEVDGNVDNAHSLAAYLERLRNIGSVREISPTGALPESAPARSGVQHADHVIISSASRA